MSSRDSAVASGALLNDAADSEAPLATGSAKRRTAVFVRPSSLAGGLQPGPKIPVAATFLAQPDGHPLEAAAAWAWLQFSLGVCALCWTGATVVLLVGHFLAQDVDSGFYALIWGGPCRKATVVFSCVGWGITLFVFVVLMPAIAIKGAMHGCAHTTEPHCARALLTVHPAAGTRCRCCWCSRRWRT